MYKKEQLEEKIYRITTEFEGKEINFNVVVANDESEVDGLVEHHLNYLSNPNPIIVEQTPQKSTEEIIQEQQETIKALETRIQALESN